MKNSDFRKLIISHTQGIFSFIRSQGIQEERWIKHETIKSILFLIAFQRGLIPIAEFPIGGTKRIDMVWFSKISRHPICAFEIDYSIKIKSIDKLSWLPKETKKIIISYHKQGRYERILECKNYEILNILI